MNGVLFIDFNLAECDFLKLVWYNMLNSYVGFLFSILLFIMTVVSVKTFEN